MELSATLANIVVKKVSAEIAANISLKPLYYVVNHFIATVPVFACVNLLVAFLSDQFASAD